MNNRRAVVQAFLSAAAVFGGVALLAWVAFQWGLVAIVVLLGIALFILMWLAAYEGFVEDSHD